MRCRREKILLLLIFVLLCTVLSGCAKENKTAAGEELAKYELDNFRNNKVDMKEVNSTTGREKILIGISLDTLKEPVWKKQRDTIIETAKKMGADVRIMQANSDDQVQLSQIDQLIAEGVNVLVIAPHDAKMLTGAAAKAHAAGIKVIAYDRMIGNSDIDYFVGIDNNKVGELQAEAVLSKVSAGKIVYIGGSQTDPNAILFHDASLRLLAKNPAVQVIADSYSPNWSAEEAYKNVMAALTANPDVQAVLCANDGTAAAALAAIDKLKLSGKNIVVTGLDAEIAACQRVVEGRQTMTVYKQSVLTSQKVVEAALALAKGEKAPTTGTLNNGFKQVDVCLIAPVAITKENMLDTIIKDNYYKLEDVYKNIPEGQRPAK